MGSQGLRVDLGCTPLGVQSCHDLLKMQLLETVQCTVYADVDVVLWNSTFLHFDQHVLFFPCQFQCVYSYVCISISLSLISPSLWKSLGVYFSLCCLLLIVHLTLTSFSSLWISLTCSLYLGLFFQLSLLCQLGDRYTVLYLTSSVTTANSETSCISNCSLVKEDKSPPSTFFLEILWEGMNGMATAMLMAIIVETGRSSGEGNGNPLQYSCLENPPGGLQSMWSQRVEHDWATSLSLSLYIHHFTYPQGILFGGFVLLHSTILPKGRLRHHMVIWLIQDCRTEPVLKSMSLPWYMHKILIIMCLINMIRKYTRP